MATEPDQETKSSEEDYDHRQALGDAAAEILGYDLDEPNDAEDVAPEDGESYAEDAEGEDTHAEDDDTPAQEPDTDPDDAADADGDDTGDKPARSQKRIQQLARKNKELQQKLEEESATRVRERAWLAGPEGRNWLQTPQGVSWQVSQGITPPNAPTQSPTQTVPSQKVDFSEMTDAQILSHMEQHAKQSAREENQVLYNVFQNEIAKFKHDLKVDAELEKLSSEYRGMEKEIDIAEVREALEYQFRTKGKMDRARALRTVDPDWAATQKVVSRKRKDKKRTTTPRVKGAAKSERTTPGRQEKLQERAAKGDKGAHREMLGNLALASGPEKPRRA